MCDHKQIKVEMKTHSVINYRDGAIYSETLAAITVHLRCESCGETMKYQSSNFPGWLAENIADRAVERFQALAEIRNENRGENVSS